MGLLLLIMGIDLSLLVDVSSFVLCTFSQPLADIRNTVLSFQVCENQSIFFNVSCVNCGPLRKPSIGDFSSDKCVEKCTAGQYVLVDSCGDCPPGQYSFSPESFCLECTSGFYSDMSGGSSCFPCPLGKYQREVNSSFCLQCPENSTTIQLGSVSVGSCYCPFGMFGKAFAGEKCLVCSNLPGIKCERHNLTRPLVEAGFYRSHTNLNLAFQCIPPQACLPSTEDINSSCSFGYTGHICGECIYGVTFKQGVICSTCPSKVAIGVTWFVVISLAIGSLWIASSDEKDVSTDLRIMIFWIQLISVFPSLSSTWPAPLRAFFQLLSIFNFDIQIASPGKHFIYNTL
jgi:hypothetical protein